MDQLELCAAAKRLAEVLLIYSSENDEVRSLAEALRPYIDDALSGRIQFALDWRKVPGGYFFSEGTLGAMPELESAYAAFKIQVAGGESEVVSKLRLSLDDFRKGN